MHRLWPSLVLFALGCSSPVPPSTPPRVAAASSSTTPTAPKTVEHASFGVTIHGTGPAVVLIPGLTCGGHVWDDTVAHLKADHTVHVLTLSGFAGRPRVDGAFLPAVRDELATHLKDLDRPVVIGHSLGGFMALWLAATEGDAIAGAIAVDGLPALGALSGQDPEAVATFAAQVRSQMEAQSQEAFAEQTQQTLLMQISDPELAAAVGKVSGRSDPAAVGWRHGHRSLAVAAVGLRLSGAMVGPADPGPNRGEHHELSQLTSPRHAPTRAGRRC